MVGRIDAGSGGVGVPPANEPILPALVERYDYDPYGHTYIESGDGLERRTASKYGNPFAWTGQRYDAGVGLYHFLYRSYSPELGRWLQRDPAGYVDGTNLYEYARSSPAVYVDPLGLSSGFADDLGGGAGGGGVGGGFPAGPPNPDPCGGGEGTDGDADGSGEGEKPELTGVAAAIVNSLEQLLERNPDHWLRAWIEELICQIYADADRATELLNQFILAQGIVINPTKSEDDDPIIPPVIGTKSDRYYGVDDDLNKEDKKRFRDWYHREYGKGKLKDADKDEMQDARDEWEERGRPGAERTIWQGIVHWWNSPSEWDVREMMREQARQWNAAHPYGPYYPDPYPYNDTIFLPFFNLAPGLLPVGVGEAAGAAAVGGLIYN